MIDEVEEIIEEITKGISAKDATEENVKQCLERLEQE